MLQVAQVVLIGIGFTLEGDIQISPSITSVLNDSDEPLNKIHDIKWHIKPFFYLCGMNQLMIESYSVARPFGKEYAKQIEGVKTFTKGNYFVVYYLHNVYFRGIEPRKKRRNQYIFQAYHENFFHRLPSLLFLSDILFPLSHALILKLQHPIHR